MDPLWSETSCRDLVERSLEARALMIRDRGGSDLRRREVRQDAFEMEFGVREEPIEKKIEGSSGRGALARHACVDLEVDGERTIPAGEVGASGLGECGELDFGPEDGGELALHYLVGVRRQQTGHDQDARLGHARRQVECERAADLRALLGIRDAEPRCALGGEDLSTESRAVTVGVGFDDCEDRGLPPAGGCCCCKDAVIVAETLF